MREFFLSLFTMMTTKNKKKTGLNLLIFVDGSNLVKYFWKNGKKYLKVNRLPKIYQYLSKLQVFYPKMNFVILADSSIYKRSRSKSWIQDQVQQEKLLVTKKGIEADEYIIKLYLKNPQKIWAITSDQFRDYKKKYPMVNNLPVFKLQFQKNQICMPKLEQALKMRYSINKHQPILPINPPSYLNGIF